MRILADEDIPRAVVSALTDQGHDVATIGDSERGAADGQIIARAERKGRVLLTFDKDFGEIVFRTTSSPTCGIILLGFVPRDPEDAVRWSLRRLPRAPTGADGLRWSSAIACVSARCQHRHPARSLRRGSLLGGSDC